MQKYLVLFVIAEIRLKMKFTCSSLYFFCYIFAFYAINSQAYALKEPLVETRYGYIRGKSLQSRNNNEYHAFRGIPYAKPPVGKLRFKAPQPPQSWFFPLDARNEVPICIQKNYLFEDVNATVTGQEDCLYLNVYVPKTKKENEQLPVMVFIHYGAFLAGNSKSSSLGPDYFMDKNVILVTFNYRLGVFGFFSTLDDIAPGNNGLKDQVAALKWVQENIKCFGGDSSQVTLFGQSAGSGSVHLHMISPASKGLFQRAVSESGTALNLWAKPLNLLQRNITAFLATFVKCEQHLRNSENLVDCLQNVDAITLAKTADYFKYFSIEPLSPYTLVTEEYTDQNPNPFLTKQPLEYLQAGEFQRVPWILGLVKDEGSLRTQPLLRNRQTRVALNANFDLYMPKMLLLDFSTNKPEILWKNIKDFYFNGKNTINVNDPREVQAFTDLYSDRAFYYGFYQTVQLHSLKQHFPLWIYSFNYRGEFSYGDLFAVTKKNINFEWGTCHCDDLLYLFKSPEYFPDLNKGTDVCLSHTMIKLWTNFAIYGHPDPSDDLKWSPLKLSKNDFHYLNISGSAKTNQLEYNIERNFFNDRRLMFWSNQSLYENF